MGNLPGNSADGLRSNVATDVIREAAPSDALRYADSVIDRRRGRRICVREDHTRPGRWSTRWWASTSRARRRRRRTLQIATVYVAVGV